MLNKKKQLLTDIECHGAERQTCLKIFRPNNGCDELIFKYGLNCHILIFNNNPDNIQKINACAYFASTPMHDLFDQTRNFRYWNNYLINTEPRYLDTNLSIFNHTGFKYDIYKLLQNKGIFREGCDIILEYAAPMNWIDFLKLVKSENPTHICMKIRFIAHLPYIEICHSCHRYMPFAIGIDQNFSAIRNTYAYKNAKGIYDPDGYLKTDDFILFQDEGDMLYDAACQITGNLTIRDFGFPYDDDKYSFNMKIITKKVSKDNELSHVDMSTPYDFIQLYANEFEIKMDIDQIEIHTL